MQKYHYIQKKLVIVCFINRGMGFVYNNNTIQLTPSSFYSSEFCFSCHGESPKDANHSNCLASVGSQVWRRENIGGFTQFIVLQHGPVTAWHLVGELHAANKPNRVSQEKAQHRWLCKQNLRIAALQGHVCLLRHRN